MILIVTYDLKSPKDYHDFYEVLKAQADRGRWWHYMASTWLISTSKTPQQILDAIHPQMESQDLVFVCELAPNYQGWLPKEAWEWINSELRPVANYLSILTGSPGAIPAATSIPLGAVPPPPDFKIPRVSHPTLTPSPKKPWEK
jgi:hypothetical protein